MKEEIKKLIAQGEFLKAKKNSHQLDQKTLRSILLNIGYDEENICSYSFICFLMIEKETKEYHYLAFEILTSSFPYLVGGYQTAIYHMRRLIELDPDNIELQENLLFFNIIPEKILSDSEAKEIAQRILLKNPESKAAKRTIFGDEIILGE